MALRILLVENSTSDRQRIRAALHGHGGYRIVGEVTSAADVLDEAVRATPDVVLVDTGMPDLAGQQVLSRLRAEVPRTKVVIFSAVDVSAADASDPEGYVDAGHLDYLLDMLDALGGRRGRQASVHLEAEPESARAARNFTARTLSEWQAEDLLDDAILVVSELVTNAVKHAGAGCELRLLLDDTVLRVESCDGGDGTPDPLPPSASRPFGRGLNLIDALTAAWGVEPLAGDGKVVWAELARERADASA